MSRVELGTWHEQVNAQITVGRGTRATISGDDHATRLNRCYRGNGMEQGKSCIFAVKPSAASADKPCMGQSARRSTASTVIGRTAF